MQHSAKTINPTIGHCPLPLETDLQHITKLVDMTIDHRSSMIPLGQMKHFTNSVDPIIDDRPFLG
jgi:hypothetical protein